MSISYNQCEYCGKSIYEDYCYVRLINRKEIDICDDCINKEIDNGNLIEIDEDDMDYKKYNKLEEVDKELLESYMIIYQYTEKGKRDKIKRINKQIKELEKERNMLF